MSDVDSRLRRWQEAAARGLMSALWGVKVTGLERVPRVGPLIVACNHVSLMDPPVLTVGIAPVRSPWFLAKRELFEYPLLGRMFRANGVIPLERMRGDVGAMRAALDALKDGGSVAIFPEGTRVKPGQVREPKTGVSFLSSRARAPVVPARAVGTDRFPWSFPLELRFGEPLPPAPEEKSEALPYARKVMEAIYKL